MPPMEMTATSVVPPPMSTIIEPLGSITGRLAPIAAAMGSSMRKTARAPALSAASCTARFSTSVTPEGMPMETRGRGRPKPKWSCAERMKYCSIFSVTTKSEMTPSRNGRTATMSAGVRPTMRLASPPMANIFLLTRSMATTEGSSMTIPRPFTITSVFAVPRSMATSWENSPSRALNGFSGNLASQSGMPCYLSHCT